jgi:GNAT superfamily N-acetyltransferase
MTFQAEGRSPSIQITGYYPGLVGDIVREHAVYYFENWGLDHSFESQVAAELGQCLAKLDPECDGLWAALSDGRFAGSVAIIFGEEGPRLRWFLVKPRFHGQGLGRLLLDHALKFCRERGYAKVHLWTFRGLEAAKRLYLAYGFVMTEENQVQQWGREIWEQRYDLDLNSPSAKELNGIF